MQSCNNGLNKNTDKFAICPEIHLLSKTETFVKHCQIKSKQGSEWDYEVSLKLC